MPHTAVITQPTYLPWLGYFEQVARANVFVFLDTVQFVKRSWHCRNKLKSSNGQPFWLSVPIAAHHFNAPLCEIRISPDVPEWRRKHLMSIQSGLGSAPYFDAVFPDIRDWLNTEYELLADMNVTGIKMISTLLDLSPHFVRASELTAQGQRTELLVSLCQQVDAKCYYSSLGSKVYLEEEKHLFDETGIQVMYQDWEHPVYNQFGQEFVPYLSVLDALMHLGPQVTRSLIISDASKP